jgi:hypothetical protein
MKLLSTASFLYTKLVLEYIMSTTLRDAVHKYALTNMFVMQLWLT